MTRTEFEKLMEQDWRIAYPVVEAKAMEVLDAMAQGCERLSTAQLAESIYPTKEAFICDTRARVFKGLEACSSRGLAPYVELGPLEQIGLTNGRRKLWGPAKERPAPKAMCPSCHRPMP